MEGFSRIPARSRFAWAHALVAVAAASSAVPAAAQEDRPAPSLTASARETLDLWDVADGGVRRGTVVLSKLQVSATAQGTLVGDAGGAAHVQLFRTDGPSLSGRVGDIQTVSNIEAPAVTRLFEAWVEQHAGAIAIRAGLMDLNADFDPLETSALFVNSSHGIGPDISKSGRNGPSIFPVSSLGARGEWQASRRVTVRVAAFDGVPGDPDHPRAFAAVRLRPSDGALLIGQADYRFQGDVKLELGGWHYTSRSAGDTVGAPRTRAGGAYGSLEGPLSARWSAWVRAGLGNAQAQSVAGYLGGGAVLKGLLRGRDGDQAGVAVAHAIISPAVRQLAALPSAETTVEATYQARFGRFVAVQPDVQWVRHPAGLPAARDALVFGLRLVLVAGYPDDSPSPSSADPTVSPEGPQPVTHMGATPHTKPR
jgi:porin